MSCASGCDSLRSSDIIIPLIRQNQIEKYSTKYLVCILEKCPCDERQKHCSED